MSSAPELLPPHSADVGRPQHPWFPRDKTFWKTPGFRLVCSGFSGIGAALWLLSQFLQLRGFVNLLASRLCLAGIVIVLAVPIWIWAWNLRRLKIVIGLILTMGLVAVVIGLDRSTLSNAKRIQIPPTSSPSSPPLVSADQLAAALAKKLGADSSHRQAVPASPSFPVLVKVHIGSDDTLMVVNEGRAGITDLEVGWGKFWFDASSAAQKTIVVSRDDYPSGNFHLVGKIGSTGSFQIDLKKLLPFEGKFSDLTPNLKPNVPEWPYPEFGLRVTFRDKQTNVKYSCYKVLSSIEHMPESWGDEAFTSGVGKPVWSDDIYPVVISRMRSHYSNDGSVDLQCDH